VGYNQTHIHVQFHVKDRYVRAVQEYEPEAVCYDSCVEFFFTPGSDVQKGYFNIEMNCGGTMLFNHQTAPGVNEVTIKDARDKFRIYHSLPVRVEPEITQPVTWVVAYGFPFKLLEDYGPVEVPAPGVIWRANFYKCGDKTSHPHWLTWSPVDFAEPNFHLPQFFGILKFL
jgi:hypothetical protein